MEELDNELFSMSICKYKNSEDEVRMAVSEFRGKLYLSIRRWYYSEWDEELFPTKDGITFPYDHESVEGLLKGFSYLLSN